MSKLQIEIELGNDAMTTPDVAGNVLRKIARDVEAGETDGPLKDINGNSIGFYRVVDDEEH